MSLRGIAHLFSVVFTAVLLMAVPVYAAESGALPEAHGTAAGDPNEIAAPADSELEPTEDAAQAEPPIRPEPDWLAVPPDPSRHSLLVPTVEWATCLALTIPLFMIDPAFVNTGRVSSEHFVEAWTRPPAWDTDGVVANYVLHPFMGAEAYLMVRNRDYGPIESFLFSTGVSVAWEYLFESWAERPSAQDLLITSNIGSLQGELRFQMRRRIAQWKPSVGRNALLVLVDPIEALHRYIGKTFFPRADDATNEMMDTALNVGPDQARVMVSMRF